MYLLRCITDLSGRWIIAMNYKKIILWTAAGIALILSFGTYFKSFDVGISDALSVKEKLQNGPHLFLPVKEYDFGTIKQSGPVIKRSFEIINDGTDDVMIGKVVTSCSCTSAKINKDLIRVGESAIVTVSFDPNYHFESYDQIERTTTIFSNALNSQRPEIKIYMKVDYDLGIDKTKYGKEKD